MREIVLRILSESNMLLSLPFYVGARSAFSSEYVKRAEDTL